MQSEDSLKIGIPHRINITNENDTNAAANASDPNDPNNPNAINGTDPGDEDGNLADDSPTLVDNATAGIDPNDPDAIAKALNITTLDPLKMSEEDIQKAKDAGLLSEDGTMIRTCGSKLNVSLDSKEKSPIEAIQSIYVQGKKMPCRDAKIKLNDEHTHVKIRAMISVVNNEPECEESIDGVLLAKKKKKCEQDEKEAIEKDIEENIAK